MQASTNSQTADLERLAVEVGARGFQAILRAPGDGPPCLTVRNPRVGVLAETVYASEGLFWWSWREPIAGVGEVGTAAGILARVLRAVGE